MSAADGRPSPGDAEERSLGELLAAASEDFQGLIRDEIALAKAEMRGTVKGIAIGSGSFGAAGVLAIASVPVLSFAAAYGIHTTGLGLVWCFLIVGGAYLALAAILAFLGIRGFKKAKAPTRALAQNKQTMSVLGKAKPRPRPAVAVDDAVRALEDKASRPMLDHS